MLLRGLYHFARRAGPCKPWAQGAGLAIRARSPVERNPSRCVPALRSRAQWQAGRDHTATLYWGRHGLRPKPCIKDGSQWPNCLLLTTLSRAFLMLCRGSGIPRAQAGQRRSGRGGSGLTKHWRLLDDGGGASGWPTQCCFMWERSECEGASDAPGGLNIDSPLAWVGSNPVTLPALRVLTWVG